LLKLEKDGSIVDSDLEIYAKYLKILSEDFKVLFEDLQRMRVPEWIVTLFDFNVQNADINSQLQDELTDMRKQSLFKRKTWVTVPCEYRCYKPEILCSCWAAFTCIPNFLHAWIWC